MEIGLTGFNLRCTGVRAVSFSNSQPFAAYEIFIFNQQRLILDIAFALPFISSSTD